MNRAKVLISLILLSSLISTSVFAQGVTLQTRGIVGDMDKKYRDPVLTVSTVVESGNVKILADAVVDNKEFIPYPLQFDFFINRKFFTSQLRSNELPGPIGIDVGSDIATPPFNYTVIARVLHPNREFTTVLNGSVFSSNLTSTFNCLLTQVSTESSKAYGASDVSSNQIGNETTGLEFIGRDAESGEEVSVSATITVTGEAASGTVTTFRQGFPQTSNVSGTATKDDSGNLASLKVQSSDGTTVLDCS